jgi:hypothetical protein
MIATKPKLYTLSDAARQLGTYHVRLRRLLDLAGIIPVTVGGQRLIDGEQLKALRRLHRKHPPRFGRPPRVPPS